MNKNPIFGIIGGSGVYQIPTLKDIESHEIETPFGHPSSPIITGTLNGAPVAFLARHGIGHRLSPTQVNYRANIFALKSIGVRKIISISACGSLRADFAPGDIVIPDQLFDFTKDRERSFFADGLVVHISSAEPVCKDLSGVIHEAVTSSGGKVHKGGTLITIEGPRFSTRAESSTFRSWGMDIIGMTACPEAFLAREAELCYATMAHVTDYDVWHVTEEPVSVDMVVKTLNKNTALAQKAIQYLAEHFVDTTSCTCESALKDAIITQRDLIPIETRTKYSLLINKYLPT
ncbi:MAG: S-methyl-5'-thioadenosine phosphorylase [Anaerolineae bacterium]|jgi:5'-methylthioadenosine phosphorylase|nr:S-methyl-5'-thioadenosine phosphorylase [Anaerolineae bacterium]